MTPVIQVESAQQAIRFTLTLLPIAICIVGIIIAFKYKLDKDMQTKIVNLIESKDSDPDYESKRQELLNQL